jgi:hypothetical protein
LNEEHKKFLINLFDDNPSTVIEQAVDNLTKQFEGLEIAKSTVHNFIKNDMGFTFKKAQFHSLKRNDDETIEKRYQWAIEMRKTDINFLKNCVFIDESGFHINMKRTQAWAPQGETPVVEVPNTRAVSDTILGAISVYAVVKVSVSMPNVPSSTIVLVATGKKRKLEDG